MTDEDIHPGEIIGEYRVDAKIGEGTFGSVYRATHPLIGKSAAIKVLHKQYSANEQVVSRFMAEARVANTIGHPCIVDIFSFGALPTGRHYFVMELLVGVTLKQHLQQRGALTVQEALPLFRDLARALDAAHQKGIAHRDVKPDNVFLVQDVEGRVRPKLLDFGIAKLAPEHIVQHRTRTGMLLGTPVYMSPEQCLGRKVDHRTDIYALGVILHQALTGQLPFQGESSTEFLMAHVTSEPPRMSHVRPGLPVTLDDGILAMLAKEPDARPQTAGAAIQILILAAQQAGLPVDTTGATLTGRQAPSAVFGTANTVRAPSAAEATVWPPTPSQVAAPQATPPSQVMAPSHAHVAPARAFSTNATYGTLAPPVVPTQPAAPLATGDLGRVDATMQSVVGAATREAAPAVRVVPNVSPAVMAMATAHSPTDAPYRTAIPATSASTERAMTERAVTERAATERASTERASPQTAAPGATVLNPALAQGAPSGARPVAGTATSTATSTAMSTAMSPGIVKQSLTPGDHKQSPTTGPTPVVMPAPPRAKPRMGGKAWIYGVVALVVAGGVGVVVAATTSDDASDKKNATDAPGCAKDTDCKGQRICRSGACVDEAEEEEEDEPEPSARPHAVTAPKSAALPAPKPLAPPPPAPAPPGPAGARIATVTRKIVIGKWPEEITFAKGSAWVALSGSTSVAKVDPGTFTITTIPNTGRLPVDMVTMNGLVHVLAQTTQAINRISWDGSVETAAQFGSHASGLTAGPDTLYTIVENGSVGSGTVTRVDTSGSKRTSAFLDQAADLAFGHGKLWVIGNATVTTLDPSTLAQTTAFPGGANLSHITIGPRGVYVRDFPATMKRIDPVTNGITAVTIGAGFVMAANDDAVLAVDVSGTVIVVDPLTMVVRERLATGTPMVPRAMALQGNRIYVTDSAGGTEAGLLYVIDIR